MGEYIERDLEEEILKYMKSREIIAVVGARQCGKTTLIKHIFKSLKNAKFISFEDREILETFSQDIDLFINLYIKNTDFLFIDEFQYAKQGGKQLKYIYDGFKTKIILTGSSVSELSIHSIKYLVGRIFVFNLYPLSFKEFLRYKDNNLYKIYLKQKFSEQLAKKINEYYNEFLIYGGYPRVALSKDNEEKEIVLKNIYNTYFLKEIKEILQLSDDFKLSKLVQVLALQLGGIINYSELCNATGFDYKNLLKNLNILIKTFICLESKPFFTNKKKELVKAPKIFFLDNGFRNFIIKNFQKASNRPDFGQLHENFIASELTKNEIELKYWRTKAGAEVDFIIEKEGKKIPIEVKSFLKDTKITKSFRNFLEAYNSKNGFIFSLNLQKEKKINQKIKINFSPLFNIDNIIKSMQK